MASHEETALLTEATHTRDCFPDTLEIASHIMKRADCMQLFLCTRKRLMELLIK